MPVLTEPLTHNPFTLDTPPEPDTTTPDRVTVLAALNRLGGSATQIAESLRVAGIKGFQGSTRQCPLATYLKDAFPNTDVRVGYADVGINSNRPGGYYQPLPTPHSLFVDSFDSGYFPYLEPTATDAN